MATANDRAVLNCILNPLLPTEDADVQIAEDPQLDHPGAARSKELEKEGVAFAEAGRLDESLRVLDLAVSECPLNASALNNRAQTKRLLSDNDGALADLEKAIEISGGEGRSGCQAFVQRAMLRRLRGDDDGAKADFQKAAQLGSSFARMQLVALNPYAAMCNKMLSDVMQTLRDGEDHST